MQEPVAPPHRNVPMAAVGMLIFVSHLILLIFFMLSGNVLSFWSPRWVISLLFILVLLAVGMGLLYLAEAGTRKTFLQVVFATGLIYMVVSALLYGTVLLLEFQDTVIDGTEASGIFTLFLFFIVTGFFSIRFSPHPHLLRSVSYAYLSMFGIYLVALAWKYLFFSPVLIASTFAVELLLLAVGAVVFGYLFVQGSRYLRR